MHRSLLCATAIFAAGQAMADSPNVAADIAPVHSLVARVMDGVGEPALIIPPGASPHDHAMRPSEARALQSADIVFWVSEDLTPWMTKPLGALAQGAQQVELLEAEGLTLHEFRDVSEEHHDDHDDHDHDHDDHDHDDHGHDDHDDHGDAHDHAEEKHDDHGHDDHGHEEDDHADAHGHHHDGVDPHAWLDPENARVWVQVIAMTLAEADPHNAEAYASNAAAAEAEIAAVQAQIAEQLAGAQGLGFITFHDAFQYFEKRFGLESSGTVSLSDAQKPSPARLAELRARIEADGIDCAFAEPQFDTRLVEAAIEGSGAGIQTIDPIGAALTPGAGQYPEMLQAMADSFGRCAAGQ